MSRYRCHSCADPTWVRGDLGDFLRHHATAHGHLAVDVPDLNDWRSKAIAELERLKKARAGDFQMHEIFAVAGDPPDHKHVNGSFSSEVESLGLAHIVRYAPSTRPGSKGSAVAVWRPGPKPQQKEAAA